MTKRNDRNYRFEFLRKLFFAKPDSSGEWRLFHLKDRGSADGRGTTVNAGDLADTSTIRGYRVCSLPKVKGKTPRIVVAPVIWVLREQRNLPPGKPIDHANRDRKDNRPENISPVTHQANAINRRTSDGGLIGVFKNSRIAEGKRCWQAVARDPVAKKRKSLKCHFTREDAARAYDAFVLKVHGPGAVTNASLGRI